jgi:hypothetical protein
VSFTQVLDPWNQARAPASVASEANEACEAWLITNFKIFIIADFRD